MMLLQIVGSGFQVRENYGPLTLLGGMRFQREVPAIEEADFSARTAGRRRPSPRRNARLPGALPKGPRLKMVPSLPPQGRQGRRGKADRFQSPGAQIAHRQRSRPGA